jgi:hypothetical protein
MGVTIIATVLLTAWRGKIGKVEGFILLGVALGRWGLDVF